jgi:CheY-like chemotaxis protein
VRSTLALSNKRIFVIEDNPGNLAITRWLLERQGAKTEYEPWGVTALHKLHKFAPVDLILLDLMFPNKVTGYQVFDTIRADKQFEDIPIVAVSAADPEEAIHKTKQHNFTGFIAKPVDFDLFPKQVYQILNGEQIWYKG